MYIQLALALQRQDIENNGHVNRHNLHYYANRNPNFTGPIEHYRRWSAIVWEGIIGKRVRRPHFFMDILMAISSRQRS